MKYQVLRIGGSREGDELEVFTSRVIAEEVARWMNALGKHFEVVPAPAPGSSAESHVAPLTVVAPDAPHKE